MRVEPRHGINALIRRGSNKNLTLCDVSEKLKYGHLEDRKGTVTINQVF